MARAGDGRNGRRTHSSRVPVGQVEMEAEPVRLPMPVPILPAFLFMLCLPYGDTAAPLSVWPQLSTVVRSLFATRSACVQKSGVCV